MITRRHLLKNASLLGMGSATPLLRAMQTNTSADPAPWSSAATAKFLARAEALKSTLQETEQPALRLVRPVLDPTRYLRWRMDTWDAIDALAMRTFRAGDSFIVDFGGHRTGYLSFSIEGVGRNVDSPARLRLIFGEVPGDVAEPLHPYRGALSEAWLPEEILTVDFLPQKVRMPRRYAFRYVKVEVIATSPSFTARFGDFRAHAVTSASGVPPPLPESVPEKLRRIDEVSLATLRDCMQTVFEDGPRRDQRLWIGDLRLQALANYASWRDFSLVRRCMYLLAAFPREDGLLHADVFEKPAPHAAGDVALDYAALFVAVLADYVRASHDLATGNELWPVAKRQLELLAKNLREDGLFIAPADAWIFVDWQPALDHSAAMQGILLYCFRRGLELARTLGDGDTAAAYTRTIAKMTAAARSAYYDESRHVFISGPSRQVSWASQAWMALAGVVPADVAATALRNAMADPASVRPGAPYMVHYVVSSLLACDQRDQARALIESYWGAMVDDGADTFWEVFDPPNSKLSPYGDVHINSFCHAWSCTPTYFLRTPGLLAVWPPR